MTHAWSGPNRVPLREEQMRPFAWGGDAGPAPQCRPKCVAPTPLTERDLKALQLADAGYTRAEIAERFGLTRGAAHQLISRARAKRRALWKESHDQQL